MARQKKMASAAEIAAVREAGAEQCRSGSACESPYSKDVDWELWDAFTDGYWRQFDQHA